MSGGEMIIGWERSRVAPKVEVKFGESYGDKMRTEVGNLGKLLQDKGQTERLYEGWQQGEKDFRQYEIVGQAERLYKLAQAWVRRDYIGFREWAKRDLGMDGDDVAGLVRGLNVGDDEVLVRREVGWWKERLERWLGQEKITPGENVILMMANGVASSDSGESGGKGEFNWNLGDPDSNLQPDDEGDDRGKTEVRERKVKQSVGARESSRLASMRPESMKLRRLVSMGCLAAIMACCAGGTLLVGGPLLESAWRNIQRKEESGQLVDPEFAEVLGNKQAAEVMADRMFWEEGWQDDPQLVEDPGRVYIEMFLYGDEGADKKTHRAYGESLLDELRKQGLLYEEGIGPWQNIVGFDEQRLRTRLEAEGYGGIKEDGTKSDEVDRLIVWLDNYLREIKSLEAETGFKYEGDKYSKVGRRDRFRFGPEISARAAGLKRTRNRMR